MSQEYHCPECGAKIGFGESICPNCNADVNSVWENAASPKKNKPKVAPGMGGLDEGDEGSPFPPAEDQGDSPFPPAGDQGGSPFPPSNEQGGGSSPFPSPSGDQDQGKAVPGTGTGEDQGGQGSPFPSPAGGDQSSGNSGSKPFPPAPEASSQ